MEGEKERKLLFGLKLRSQLVLARKGDDFVAVVTRMTANFEGVFK